MPPRVDLEKLSRDIELARRGVASIQSPNFELANLSVSRLVGASLQLLANQALLVSYLQDLAGSAGTQGEDVNPADEVGKESYNGKRTPELRDDASYIITLGGVRPAGDAGGNAGGGKREK